MLSPAQIRARLRAAAHGVFSMDDGVTAETAEWLAGLTASDLLRVDGFARQWRVDGPTLGSAQQWTREVLQQSETAAAIGAMHADGFVRERSLRRLAADHSSTAMRMIAVRALDHVPQVRVVARVQLAQRTSLQQAAEIMPILERSDARSLGSEVRASYLDSICAVHGEETVWEVLRRSADRDMRRAAYRHSAMRDTSVPKTRSAAFHARVIRSSEGSSLVSSPIAATSTPSDGSSSAPAQPMHVRLLLSG